MYFVELWPDFSNPFVNLRARVLQSPENALSWNDAKRDAARLRTYFGFSQMVLDDTAQHSRGGVW